MRRLIFLVLVTEVSAQAQVSSYAPIRPTQSETSETVATGSYDPERAFISRNAHAKTQHINNAHIPPRASLQAQGGNGEIYRCRDNNGRDVYVDADYKHRYRLCTLIHQAPSVTASNAPVSSAENAPIHAPLPSALPTLMAAETSLPTACAGAIRYQGNTYLFSENEPCPIPASVFALRTPLEASPAYYDSSTTTESTDDKPATPPTHTP